MTDGLPPGTATTGVKAELFKGVGHPARILILELLADGPVSVSALRHGTGLEPSNLSQHLGVLRRQHVIVPSRRDGRLFYQHSCAEVGTLLEAARVLLETVIHGPGAGAHLGVEAQHEASMR